MKKRKINVLILSLVLFLFLHFCLTNTFNKIYIKAASNDYDSSAKAMIVLESSTNTILYSKNKDEKLPMASTTKIITALVVIESCDDLDKLITISEKAINIEGSSI